jgi:hypothetical protein
MPVLRVMLLEKGTLPGFFCSRHRVTLTVTGGTNGRSGSVVVYCDPSATTPKGFQVVSPPGRPDYPLVIQLLQISTTTSFHSTQALPAHFLTTAPLLHLALNA